MGSGELTMVSFGGHIHRAGDILNVIWSPHGGACGDWRGGTAQQGHHHQLQDRQRQAEQGGGQGKHDQTDEV